MSPIKSRQCHKSRQPIETSHLVSAPTPTVVQSPSLQRYGSSFLMEAVNLAQQEERARAQPRDELKGYLSSPLEVTNTDCTGGA
jgi:hypothetical protein